MNATRCSPALFAVVGICAAFMFALALVSAINADASWVYGESSLIDLKNSSVQVAADLMQYGSIVFGILLIVFGFGKGIVENKCGRASGFMLAIAGVFVVLLGLDTQIGNENVESSLQILFLALLTISVVLSAYGNWYEGKNLNVALIVILFVVAFVAVCFKPLEASVVIIIACMLIWIVGESVKMILNINKA